MKDYSKSIILKFREEARISLDLILETHVHSAKCFVSPIHPHARISFLNGCSFFNGGQSIVHERQGNFRERREGTWKNIGEYSLLTPHLSILCRAKHRLLSLDNENVSPAFCLRFHRRGYVKVKAACKRRVGSTPISPFPPRAHDESAV